MGPPSHPGQVEQTKWKNAEAAGKGQTAGSGRFCSLCGAWFGCLGLEESPEAYIEHLVEVFRGVWRVLRDDGILYCNLGDGYARTGGWSSNDGLDGKKRGESGRAKSNLQEGRNGQRRPPGLKEKDLMMMPARVAIALQNEGWYLRSDITWAKALSLCPVYSGSIMPESCRDRPTSSSEHVFLLSKKPNYFYDDTAVREKGAYPAGTRAAKGSAQRASEFGVNSRPAEYATYSGSRNLRNVWAIPEPGVEMKRMLQALSDAGVDPEKIAEAVRAAQRTAPALSDVFCVNPKAFKGAHFAAFAPALVRQMVLSGTSEYGACEKCGAPYERVVEKTGDRRVRWSSSSAGPYRERTHQATYDTAGWKPTCSCDAGVRPCVVIDPFSGAGTSALVAKMLGRDYVGIEMNPEYADLARMRLGKPVVGEKAKATARAKMPLFAGLKKAGD